jgi:thiamine biosynthesis lipoprotein
MRAMKQGPSRGYLQTRIFMDTVVVMEIVAPGCDEADLAERTDRAFGWFAEVERRCSRFDEASELRNLSRHTGEAVAVSPLLFNALDLALQLADLTDGALDPTVGRAMEESGFDTNYVSGQRVVSRWPAELSGTYRDIVLDRDAQTVELLRPLALDLGAIAKGFAVDLAAQELREFHGFVINAGGDVLARGCNDDGDRWTVGVQHPRRDDELLTSLRIKDAAVCTSGDYERRQAGGHGHHILDPVTGGSAHSVVAATVIAPTAVVADALSTAAFVLGPGAGIDFLEGHGVDGFIVGADLSVSATCGLAQYLS